MRLRSGRIVRANLIASGEEPSLVAGLSEALGSVGGGAGGDEGGEESRSIVYGFVSFVGSSGVVGPGEAGTCSPVVAMVPSAGAWGSKPCLVTGIPSAAAGRFRTVASVPGRPGIPAASHTELEAGSGD